MLAFKLIIFNPLQRLLHLNLIFNSIQIHSKFDYILPCMSALLHNSALIILFVLNYQEFYVQHQTISLFLRLCHFTLSYFSLKRAQSLNEHFKESD